MSIQLRLNLAIGILSALGLVCMIAFILVDARPRMEAENASTMLLTETLVKSSVATLKDTVDPRHVLDELVGEMKSLRHAAVSLASRMPRTDGPSETEEAELRWLSFFKGDPPQPIRIPVEVRGERIDTIVVTPRPDDEFSELWEAVTRIFQWGVIVSAVTIFLTWLIVNRSLSPIRVLRDAMRRMEAGKFDLRVPEVGPPEIKSICSGLNGLAGALQKAREENQRLTTNMILIQDEERRDIARELHDELGPYLFSIRTDASLLGKELEKSHPDLARAARLDGAILRQVDLLQQTNRRVLERLAPAGLSELGLERAIGAMVDMWRRDRTEIDLALHASGALDQLDGTTQLTVYRIVQEGLTNAFRHSGATRIEVEVEAPHELSAPPASSESAECIRVDVRDNGRGRNEAPRDGFGLKAMRERVNGLCGAFSIAPSAGGGTLLRVTLPVNPERGQRAA